MSDDDLLANATRALREETAPRTDGDETLKRLEHSLRKTRTTRARWIAWPVAAAFLVLTAWASASGRLARLIAPTPVVQTETPSPMPPPEPLPAPVRVVEVVPSASESPPPPKPLPVDVDALYRDAHEAHFTRRDPEAALAAWDRYLAAAGPNGKFVLEARYNRALSLVRLGRKSEARAALGPFARGDYGGYRRDEATKLLENLE